MTASSEPVYRSGKICYVEIPTTDIRRSAEFYAQAFGWEVRQRGDGSTAFNDTVGQVSGSWVLGRPPSTEPGILIHIMVGDAAKTVEAVIAAAGEIVQPVNTDQGEVLATFRDPGGNILGICQQPGLAESEARLVDGHASC
jgi:predicted enzyme related to lactoylglutathione lyase